MGSPPPLPLDLEAVRQATKTCACANLRKAARAVTQLYDEALRPAGVLATQLPLLMTTRQFEPVTVNQLAEATVMDRTTLTRNLRPLQRDGLIRIAPGKDRRVREVSLTRKGHTALAQAYPLWQAVQARVAERMGAERLQHLVAELTATVEAVRG